MSFSSFEFIAFTTAAVVLFYVLRPRLRWGALLVASAIFYASFKAPYLLAALAFVILTTYAFGLWIHQSAEKRRKRLFVAGVALNLAVLIGFRFFPLAYQGLVDALKLANPALSAGPMPALLALGVSFYVFQAISYLADIFLERIEPESHLGRFAVFMSFYPKLLQGPIERAENLLPQLALAQPFSYVNARDGLRRFAWGFFKKVVVADRLALLVFPIFDQTQQYSGLALILGIYAYALQLYFDFSGYTDMALGIAKLFNLRLAENFNRPYLARTIGEFWKRWHISFSSWILDYIFKPLQISWRRRRRWGVAAALMVTFLLSGLWHGASWGFLAWGFLHGLYMALETVYLPLRRKLYRKLRIENSPVARAWQVFLTFNLVSFAWIFFRANNISDALYYVTHLFSGVEIISCAGTVFKYLVYLPITQGTLHPGGTLVALKQTCAKSLENLPAMPGSFSSENLVVLLASLALLAIAGFAGKRVDIGRWNPVFRWLGYLVFSLWVLFAMVILELPNQAYQEFLYFRF